LRTDYVDVIALHEPDPAVAVRDDIVAALTDVVRSGKARAAGIAGSGEAALAAARAGMPVKLVQVADGLGEHGVAMLRRQATAALAKVRLVTHSIYSQPLLSKALLAAGEQRRLIRLWLEEAGYEAEDYSAALRAAALDHALQSNADGTVLLAMFRRQHISANLSRLYLSDRHELTGLVVRIQQLTAQTRSGAA
jgi:aryl-alcohol dehydrogenase-like predicted oxidoreductase